MGVGMGVGSGPQKPLFSSLIARSPMPQGPVGHVRLGLGIEKNGDGDLDLFCCRSYDPSDFALRLNSS
jgi:hypothetical protein